MVKIYLKPGKEEPVRRFHHWVFSGAIARAFCNPADGDVVKVLDKTGNGVSEGHFHHVGVAARSRTVAAACG